MVCILSACCAWVCVSGSALRFFDSWGVFDSCGSWRQLWTDLGAGSAQDLDKSITQWDPQFCPLQHKTGNPWPVSVNDDRWMQRSPESGNASLAATSLDLRGFSVDRKGSHLRWPAPLLKLSPQVSPSQHLTSWSPLPMPTSREKLPFIRLPDAMCCPVSTHFLFTLAVVTLGSLFYTL